MTDLKLCEFCNAELAEPTEPMPGQALIHPGQVDDGTCILAGWAVMLEPITKAKSREPKEPTE